MIRFLPLLLTGCPYVFGAPDLSNVGGDPADADTDTDTDADTDTDTDTDADTDTDTEPNGAAPTIVEIEPLQAMDRLSLNVSVADPDGDLIGGSMRMTDGGTDVAFWAIPADFVSFNAVGVSIADYVMPAPLACTGWSPDLVVTMTDFAGNESPPFPFLHTVHTIVASSGFATVDAVELPGYPTTWCSTSQIDPAAPNPQEKDQVEFPALQSGALDVSLTWSDSDLVDIDLFLFRGNGDIGSDNTASFTGFAAVTSALISAGDPITVQVTPWAAGGGAANPEGPWDYQVIVQAVP